MIVLVLRPVLDCGLTCIFTLRSGPRICCSAVGPRKSLPAIGLGAQSGAALQGRGVLFGTSVSRYKRLGGTRLNAIGQRCRSVSCARSMTKLRYPTLASPRPLYISQLGARHLFPLSLIEGRPTAPRPTSLSTFIHRRSPDNTAPGCLPKVPNKMLLPPKTNLTTGDLAIAVAVAAESEGGSAGGGWTWTGNPALDHIAFLLVGLLIFYSVYLLALKLGGRRVRVGNPLQTFASESPLTAK